jgi:chromosome segregation ATPase
MTDQDRFRFRLEDEEPEVSAQDDELRRRVKKLGLRVSFLSLLLPCLLAIVVYVAYREISLRMNETRSTELRSVDRLSADLEQQLEAVKARVTELEASLSPSLETARNSILALQESVRKAEAAVEKIDAAKTDKKETSEALARIDAALAANAKEIQALAPFREELGSAAAMRKELNAVSARLQQLENSLGKDLTGLAGYMDRTKADLGQIKAELAGLQSRKMDREAMDLEVLKAKKLFQIALDQEILRIDKTVSALQRRLEQVERAYSSRPSAPPALPPLSPGFREQPIE